jgi:hypothetical protein
VANEKQEFNHKNVYYPLLDTGVE